MPPKIIRTNGASTTQPRSSTCRRRGRKHRKKYSKRQPKLHHMRPCCRPREHKISRSPPPKKAATLNLSTGFPHTTNMMNAMRTYYSFLLTTTTTSTTTTTLTLLVGVQKFSAAGPQRCRRRRRNMWRAHRKKNSRRTYWIRVRLTRRHAIFR